MGGKKDLLYTVTHQRHHDGAPGPQPDMVPCAQSSDFKVKQKIIEGALAWI